MAPADHRPRDQRQICRVELLHLLVVDFPVEAMNLSKCLDRWFEIAHHKPGEGAAAYPETLRDHVLLVEERKDLLSDRSRFAHLPVNQVHAGKSRHDDQQLVTVAAIPIEFSKPVQVLGKGARSPAGLLEGCRKQFAKFDLPVDFRRRDRRSVVGIQGTR